MEKIEVVICHFGPDELLDGAVASLEAFYPELEITIIDDNNYHYGHGKCLDLAFDSSKSDLIITMDNDIRLYKKGLLEAMLKLLKKDVYGVGEFVGHKVGFIHPKLALWRRELVVNAKTSFKDCLVYCRECNKTYEYQTGQLLGYQLSLRYGLKGVSLPVLDYAHHLSEKK